MKRIGIFLLITFFIIGLSGCTNTNEKDLEEELDKILTNFKEEIQNTEKVVLAVHDDNGEILGLDGWTYKEKQVITNQETITKIINVINKATLQLIIETNYIGKLIQFYDGNDNLIAEYEGHCLLNEDYSIGINVNNKDFNSLLYLFEQ
mgnify:FL=1